MEALSEELAAQRMFLNKLSKLYSRATEEQLKEYYSIHSINLFDVQDEFPMLRRGDISPGIANAKYEIFTAFLENFNVTEKMEKIIKNG